MIHFENIKLVNEFIREFLIDKEKSTLSFGMFGVPDVLYLKTSSKEFTKVDDIINELKRLGLLYEITEFNSAFYTQPQIIGYILNYSQIKMFMAGEEDFLNNQIYINKLLTINQACEFLNITRPTLYKLIKNNEIKPLELFGKKRIQVVEILNYISLLKRNSND
jgi:excisionase family DNA binding protein